MKNKNKKSVKKNETQEEKSKDNKYMAKKCRNSNEIRELYARLKKVRRKQKISL